MAKPKNAIRERKGAPSRAFGKAVRAGKGAGSASYDPRKTSKAARSFTRRSNSESRKAGSSGRG